MWCFLSPDPVWRWWDCNSTRISVEVYWVTAQTSGHKADVHPAGTHTEAHQQNLLHIGGKTKRHRSNKADPTHPHSTSTPRAQFPFSLMNVELGSQKEEERRGSIDFCFIVSKNCYIGENSHWIINVFIQFWCLFLSGQLEVPEWVSLVHSSTFSTSRQIDRHTHVCLSFTSWYSLHPLWLVWGCMCWQNRRG